MTLSIEQLSNGLPPEYDFAIPSKPDEPEMREGVSIWLFDEKGEIGFPRIAIEAEASRWDKHGIQMNIAYPDGRVLIGSGIGPAHSPLDSDGRPTILGAGGLTFRCIEPFRRWTIVFEGPAYVGAVQQQIDGTYGTQGTTPVRLEAELTMVTPSWVQEYSTDTANMTALEQANAAAMGLGYRYEHHLRAVGTFEADGVKRPFKGVGTRIHRHSIRRLLDFNGHCWQSAVFPDGRAFGSLVYPPKSGAPSFSFNDAVIYQDGRLVPAQVVEAVFLDRLAPDGEDVSLVIESEFGRANITAKTAFTTYTRSVKEMNGLHLHQGGALYSWDGQSAYGMIERSRYPNEMTGES